MQTEERNLLNNFLNKFNQIPAPAIDPEANTLIRQGVRRPDAPYLLVQQAIVQEIALQEAEKRIQQLEQELQAARGSSAFAPRSNNFLGGRRGGWNDAPTVPAGWGSSAPAPFVQPRQGGGVGGFLATAAATVAGVAGGALLFQGLSNLMGSDAGNAAAGAVASDLGGFDLGGFFSTPDASQSIGEDSGDGDSSGDSWV